MAWMLVGDVAGPTIWDSLVDTEEDVLAVWEDVAGFRPIVRERGNCLVVRAYSEGASSIYEGMPDFDEPTWYEKGANSRVIAERVYVWRVGPAEAITFPGWGVLAVRQDGITLDARRMATLGDVEERFGAKAERIG